METMTGGTGTRCPCAGEPGGLCPFVGEAEEKCRGSRRTLFALGELVYMMMFAYWWSWMTVPSQWVGQGILSVPQKS